MTERQDFVTIAIPFADRTEWAPLALADVERAVAALGNPANKDIAKRLRDTGIVHFASIHVIPADEPDSPAHLLIEATVDGPANKAVDALAGALAADLLPILAMIGTTTRIGEVEQLLRRHAYGISPAPLRWFGRLAGLPFNGIPGLTVKAICENREIVKQARQIVARVRAQSSASGPQTVFTAVDDALGKRVRDRPGAKPERLSFTETASAPWLEFERSEWNIAWFFRALRDAWQLLVLAVALPYLAALVILKLTGASTLVSASAAIAPGLVFVALFASLLALLLRRDETANRPIDRTPSPELLGRMMALENAQGCVQNHMISVTRLRASSIRRLSLALGFYAIAAMARIGLMRSGFLATIGTIHAARWIVLPKTRQLLFCSNYDGSWESYLEDFITKSAKGVTCVWSNTEGFPSTELLFFKGAEDGDRMKRFARASMQPTPFWFSAYPDLTCTQIRKHALIVSGLHCAERVSVSPSDAEAWLDLFGSIPRPDYGLQYEEIQTLMFGGLSRHPHSSVVALRFGKPRKGLHPYTHVQQWLADLIAADTVSFGDKPAEDFVCNLAFSAEGLRLLGLDAELDISGAGAVQGFPAAFALGMSHPSRKRALDDPQTLEWTEHDAHVTLLLYARNQAAAARFDTVIAQAVAAGLTDPITIQTGLNKFKPADFRAAWDASDPNVSAPAENQKFLHASADSDAELTVEPFGFVDGVSQPLVRGFPGRHGAPDPIHAVEPGEFILGYADNRGYYPPSPLIARDMSDRGMEPGELLPSPPPDQPSQYPDFSARAAMARDFGRNGSYLVIRQLAQDVETFRNQLDAEAERLCSQPDVINPHNGNLHRTREWIAAKMVGRWRDGSSLVDHPFHPAFRNNADAVETNDFLYKTADPQGLRCPFGAHVRRTFPRDSLAQTDPFELSVSNRHRLLRRGRPYLGDDGKTAKGTLFICFNADIERQFEFVQQTWLGSPAFHGLEREPDPFVMHHGGRNEEREGGPQRFTITGRNAALELCPVKRHVTLRGGGYFFMPGRHAIWFLAGDAFDQGVMPMPTLAY
ncbi:deferrochelatase/peroxidase EfeB [Novosphingobium hassiacum]|uniref:Deferrochelatase/peroxidase EfeB n=1 Tax=Novosphingobium hassiacum TaxID=173676 RepID=A0A7W5ZTG9_9SPHN|nr:hypothetical protein [Novosphingobium hassiacum]MBB3859641.1 deferrochelatase/peroxidase EfeB [Novosphingobium hassiacum]